MIHEDRQISTGIAISAHCVSLGLHNDAAVSSRYSHVLTKDPMAILGATDQLWEVVDIVRVRQPQCDQDQSLDIVQAVRTDRIFQSLSGLRIYSLIRTRFVINLINLILLIEAKNEFYCTLGFFVKLSNWYLVTLIRSPSALARRKEAPSIGCISSPAGPRSSKNQQKTCLHEYCFLSSMHSCK